MKPLLLALALTALLLLASYFILVVVSYASGYEETAEPIWRIAIDGYCADFETETAANNFRAAMLSAAPPPPMQPTVGEDK